MFCEASAGKLEGWLGKSGKVRLEETAWGASCSADREVAELPDEMYVCSKDPGST